MHWGVVSIGWQNMIDNQLTQFIRKQSLISIPTADLAAIAQLINDECGLVIASKDHRSLAAAIQSRMNDLETGSFDRFNDVLRHSRDEIHRLADLITINETYFFREKPHFDLLIDSFLPKMLEATSGRLKILSAGCATGEEPYSLAIGLMEKYGPRILSSISIMGCDLDRNAIRRAKDGLYSKYSMRNTSPFILGKYFNVLSDRRYKLIDGVKDHVRFYKLNLLSPHYPHPFSGLDVIFYRNVSIYLDPETRKLVFGQLNRHLKDNGYLFMSSAETYGHNHGVLSLVKINGIFLFRKTDKNKTTDPISHRPEAITSSPSVANNIPTQIEKVIPRLSNMTSKGKKTPSARPNDSNKPFTYF